jgi:hypothetical protein
MAAYSHDFPFLQQHIFSYWLSREVVAKGCGTEYFFKEVA